MGDADSFVTEKYASHYFWRSVLFHVALIMVIWFYDNNIQKNRLIDSGQKRISGTQGLKKITIKTDLVKWIEADDHYLKIHFNDGQLLKRSTLEQLAKELDPDFIWIHRK
jgi:DNA-binding LytR/AlgR family response regulator